MLWTTESATLDGRALKGAGPRIVLSAPFGHPGCSKFAPASALELWGLALDREEQHRARRSLSVRSEPRISADSSHSVTSTGPTHCDRAAGGGALTLSQGGRQRRFCRAERFFAPNIVGKIRS
jgi:hypothetical protein